MAVRELGGGESYTWTAPAPGRPRRTQPMDTAPAVWPADTASFTRPLEAQTQALQAPAEAERPSLLTRLWRGVKKGFLKFFQALGLYDPPAPRVEPQAYVQVRSYRQANGLDQHVEPKAVVPRVRQAVAEQVAPLTYGFHTDSVKATPAELKGMSPQAFFAALRPAAEAAEREYGVPAAVTLAQAALESGWGKHAIAGYNIFGIKGKGSGGSALIDTHEEIRGQRVKIQDRFAVYGSYDEAFAAHGRLFHNGYYDKAMAKLQRHKDPHRFAQDITGTYATSSDYGRQLSKIMRDYGLA